MLKSFGDDRNVIYKSNTSNTILYGIRGTKPSSGTDWLTDLSIASKALRQKLPFDKRDYLEAPMKERYDNANNIYRQLRELYPKSKIIIGAIMTTAEDIEAKAELDAMWDAAMGVVDLAETDVLVAAGGASAAVASLGLTAVMALLLGYGFYSHLSGHFEPEQNRFIYKKHKPPRIKTGF
jgi:hypothetical protein